MNISHLFSELSATNDLPLNRLIPKEIAWQAPQEKLDFMIDLRTTSFRQLREHLIQHCQRDPSIFNLVACEAVALWMVDRHGQNGGHKEGAAVFSWLAAREEATASVLLNYVVLCLAKTGIEKNQKNAFRHLQRALKLERERTYLRGLILVNMGNFHLDGIGVKRDVGKALNYLTEAVETGVTDALFNLGCILSGRETATPIDLIDLNLASMYYTKAISQGCIKSQTNLALLHVLEQVDNADKIYGYKLLKLSAAEGDQVALEALQIEL